MAKGKRPKRPPIDRSKILDRLDRACDDQLFVRIRRWIPQADQIEGFVVARSTKWLLLARVSDQIALDGWIALRIRDVQSVTIYPEKDGFEVKALRARNQWPPKAADQVDLSTTARLLETASQSHPMIAIQREFERTDVAWIGALQGVSQTIASLLEVNVAAGWMRKPRTFDLDDITRIDFGGGYEEALLLVAGPAPKPRAAHSEAH